MMRQKTRDDLGLALTMLDSDRLRQWAEKLDTYGSDISHWADRRFVIEQLRAVAGRIEATVREVGTLRGLAGIEPDAKDAIPPGPEGGTAKPGEEIPVGWCQGGGTRPHHLKVEWGDHYTICTTCKRALSYNTATELAKRFSVTPPPWWPAGRLRKPVAEADASPVKEERDDA
jgi:hypothetical protein